MARDDSNRNLLFGLLALQNGMIDQSALVAAFHSWTRDKDRPMADHLIARGDIEEDQRAAVEALVTLHLKKHGGSPEESLAAVAVGRATREGLAQVGDPEIEASLGHTGPGPGPEQLERNAGNEDTITVSAGSATGDGQRFRVLRPHARGGLGEVFVALDGELNREVALKRIRPERADDPSSRARFLLEAEVTGHLEHPGVVPVYSLSVDGSGRSFYVMRLVKGETLKQAVDRFHLAEQQEGRDPDERAVALRQLLGRFVDVCNAVAYAHSRGVLHRDLKPENIMLGPFGESLIVDWGMAKVVDRRDAGVATDSGEVTLRSASVGSSETQPGAAVGTPAYMSPEQAAGRLDLMGPASDVYSLGATLYYLLAGRPPFRDADVGRVLREVQHGMFPRPGAVVASADPVLEAVCVKAMAREPADRYASARALADEVELWLASDYRRLQEAHQQLQEAHEELAVALREQNQTFRRLADMELQAVRNLKESQVRLVQSEKRAALSMMVAGVVHEIGNPLAFVADNVAALLRDIELLQGLIRRYQEADALIAVHDSQLAGRIRDLSESIDLPHTWESVQGLVRSGETLSRIRQVVKHLRNYNRLDEGQAIEGDINRCIESTVTIISDIVRGKKQVQIALDLGVLPRMTCHAAQIQQVMMNLLANAIDACSEGGLVEVRTRAEDQGVLIEVADNGCGIEPEHRDRIFDPFFTTKGMDQGGTGLGLSVCYGVVEAHGGRIEVESAVGQGTRFVVRLPLRDPKAKVVV